MQNIKMNPAHFGRGGSWTAFRTAAIALAVIFMAPGWASATADMDKLDVEGLRLGMTVEEAKAAIPDLEVREVTRGGAHVGFEAQRGQAHVSFSSRELGSRIFHVQVVKVYRDKPDPFPIYMEYVKKYGRPDFGGRQMMSIQACWGRCYGSFKRLEFSMTVVGFGKKPFPMTLTLSDPELEKANHELFRKNLEGTKSK